MTCFIVHEPVVDKFSGLWINLEKKIKKKFQYSVDTKKDTRKY